MDVRSQDGASLTIHMPGCMTNWRLSATCTFRCLHRRMPNHRYIRCPTRLIPAIEIGPSLLSNPGNSRRLYHFAISFFDLGEIFQESPDLPNCTESGPGGPLSTGFPLELLQPNLRLLCRLTTGICSHSRFLLLIISSADIL